MITLLNQPWTERLGWTLLHFLWQGAAIAAVPVLSGSSGTPTGADAG